MKFFVSFFVFLSTFSVAAFSADSDVIESTFDENVMCVAFYDTLKLYLKNDPSSLERLKVRAEEAKMTAFVLAFSSGFSKPSEEFNRAYKYHRERYVDTKKSGANTDADMARCDFLEKEQHEISVKMCANGNIDLDVCKTYQ